MPSALAAAIARNRAAILRRDRETLGRLLAAYADADERLRPLVQLAEQALRDLGADATPGKALQLERLRLLQNQLDEEMTRLAQLSARETHVAQANAVDMAEDHAVAVVEATATAAEGTIAASWANLPTDAIEQFIGAASNDSPLGSLFADLPDKAGDVFIQELTNGLALGQHPTVTADAVAKATGMNRDRALLISRTETLQAYRRATGEAFRENADVLDGWIWISAPDACAACQAMDGTKHDLDEEMDSHPACRCSKIPSVRGVDLDLGPRGDERFQTLTADQQDDILGKAGGEAYRNGEVSLQDFVQRRQSEEWGPSITQDSLKGALENAEARGGGIVGEGDRFRALPDRTEPLSDPVLIHSNDFGPGFSLPETPTIQPSVPYQTPSQVIERESEIVGNTTESAHVYDRDGNLILSKAGDVDSVRFEPEELPQLQDSVFTHNHPGGETFQNGFSDADLNFSFANDVQEMRAVSGDMAISLVRPADGWPSPDQLPGLLDNARAAVVQDMRAEHAAGTLTRPEAERTLYLRINEKVADQIGATFRIDPR